jgi:hypothetical protein
MGPFALVWFFARSSVLPRMTLAHLAYTIVVHDSTTFFPSTNREIDTQNLNTLWARPAEDKAEAVSRCWDR